MSNREGNAQKSPSFIEPMQALAVEKPPDGDWLYEVKLDGYRALAFKDGKDVRLVSRNQKAFNYPQLLDALKSLPAEQIILDGEIVALDEKGRSSFVCLDPCACLTYGYCWRGSEYLRTIGNRVGKPEKIRATGTPTLLGFDVTIEELGEEQINSIAGQAIGLLYENWRRPDSIKRAVDFGFPLFKPVMPYQIREVLPLEDKA
jgi:hypothetical protein